MHPIKLLGAARALADISKDPSTKVGAIIVDNDGNILSAGFNGFPRNVTDSKVRYLDKKQKYPRIVHAEMNAIAIGARVGARLLDSTLIVTALYPCTICARLIIQAGIKRIFAPKMSLDTNPLWLSEGQLSQSMFNEAKIKVYLYSYVDGKLRIQPARPWRYIFETIYLWWKFR